MAPFLPGRQLTVPVYWHVVHASTGEGMLTADDIARQIDALNDAFAGAFGGVDTGIRFSLLGQTVTESDAWFPLYSEDDPAYSPAEWEMHTTLISDVDPNFTDHEVLHVFSTRADNALGWVNMFPYEFDVTVDRWWDGVTVNYDTISGVGIAPYDEGDTLVHEVGHWLGLHHTFAYGCAPGDFVDDTPASSEAAYGCPATAPDTCPDEAHDAIDNYMSYYDDVCMVGFTAGQAMLMRGSYMLYREPPR